VAKILAKPNDTLSDFFPHSRCKKKKKKKPSQAGKPVHEPSQMGKRGLAWPGLADPTIFALFYYFLN
jgi:hypothetical protein